MQIQNINSKTTTNKNSQTNNPKYQTFTGYINDSLSAQTQYGNKNVFFRDVSPILVQNNLKNNIDDQKQNSLIQNGYNKRLQAIQNNGNNHFQPVSSNEIFEKQFNDTQSNTFNQNYIDFSSECLDENPKQQKILQNKRNNQSEQYLNIQQFQNQAFSYNQKVDNFSKIKTKIFKLRSPRQYQNNDDEQNKNNDNNYEQNHKNKLKQQNLSQRNLVSPIQLPGATLKKENYIQQYKDYLQKNWKQIEKQRKNQKQQEIKRQQQEEERKKIIKLEKNSQNLSNQSEVQKLSKLSKDSAQSLNQEYEEFKRQQDLKKQSSNNLTQMRYQQQMQELENKKSSNTFYGILILALICAYFLYTSIPFEQGYKEISYWERYYKDKIFQNSNQNWNQIHIDQDSLALEIYMKIQDIIQQRGFIKEKDIYLETRQTYGPFETNTILDQRYFWPVYFKG
ncbi:hypothetical protein PPERSA_06180 [Pseudocohnilembus persalinus]|uniref:Transmembrane protein n=1 Tax=Pseudocohnilembus persalinus TaxID=266149 RepID=A0A0V0R0E9_PSEPJ|nr:hypothetical protein PPERSA_06180 [Pseudocohnilembus persalinus]|eukprot:KRX08002.1 hypothetical protein PPERSA_06180 [Pseudocohnilembus persalinus]